MSRQPVIYLVRLLLIYGVDRENYYTNNDSALIESVFLLHRYGYESNEIIIFYLNVKNCKCFLLVYLLNKTYNYFNRKENFSSEDSDKLNYYI
jgi:hypothetical protein